MIIKGTSRTGPAALGIYLETAEKNERAKVMEIKGTLAKDLVGALKEMDAYAEGTKCEKPLYHAMISPEPPHRLSFEQMLESVDLLEKNLGLEGHPRAVVMHEHQGREHFHVVWARIDLKHLRAVSDSHNYRKHEETSRELERRFGHNRIQGAHAERENVKRPDRTPSRAELRQEKQTGIKGKDVREEVTALYRASDDAKSFQSALEDKGYLLARGDRRDFVIVDRAGGVHSLARRIEDVNAADLRTFMKPIDRENLLAAWEARDIQLDRADGRANARDEIAYDDKLAQAAIDKARADEERLKDMRQEQREVFGDNLIAKGYGSGEDYVHQTTAALNDYKRRQDVSDEPRPERPDEVRREEELLRRQAEDTTKRHEAEKEILGSHPEPSVDLPSGELTDAKQTRFERLLNTAFDDGRSRDTGDPDRQRKAPGGGRTRSR